MNKSSLLSNDEVNVKPQRQELNKRCFGIALIIFIISLSVVLGVLVLTYKRDLQVKIEPIKIKIALPPYKPFPIILGNSRVIQILFYSGFDNRTLDTYKTVTQRGIVWQTCPEGIVTIDPYGRLQTIKIGKTVIKVRSSSSPDKFAEHEIEVISGQTTSYRPHKRIINYEGGPSAQLNKVMQKIVTWKTKEQALLSKEVPQSIKNMINDPQIEPKRQVYQGNIVWKIENYADGSNRTFIKRINIDQPNIRDRIMYLIGNRYLPGDGLSVLSIQDDQELGLWTVNLQGQVSHIQMKSVSYLEKAEIMVQNTQKYVLRHGIASSSTLVNGTWKPDYVDSDGLWTSMYAAGQLMRFSSLKTYNYSEQQIKKAKESALYSLKAVLLISNVACRNITVDARIRHFTNTIVGSGYILSSEFLKTDKNFAVEQYVGKPTDSQGFYGIDAGKMVNGKSYGGKYKYSFLPFHNSDWSNNSKIDSPATSKRTLNGFISRSFLIQPLDGTPTNGLFFRHNKNGTQQVLYQASKLYDFSNNQRPNLDLGNMDLPSVLKDFLKINGTQYDKFDLIYKGDTSTDSLIGHLFAYKIAFDILSESDPEQNSLKQLIKLTMINFGTHLINNGYTLVDATGQGTSWGKVTRTFMNSDYTLEDAPLKALQLLMSFKLCYYVTGDQSWQREYQFLIEDESFRYLDLVASLWKRWNYNSFNQIPNNLDSSVNYSQIQIARHMIANIHYSDQEEAFLAFYLAFQLQDRQEYLGLYREGIEGWWHSVSRSQNYLWYYIYQLAYSKQPKKDYFGNNLLDISSWQLSRHPIDTRRTCAFVQGSRLDVILQGENKKTLSIDPNHILQRRKSTNDVRINQRKINYKVIKDYDPYNIYEFKVVPPDERQILRFNSATFQNIFDSSPNTMFPSTSYTLPYWMGIYHKMLRIQQ